MTLIIVGAVLTVISLVTSYFLTDRSRWRQFVLLVGIVGAALSFAQGYRNLERAVDLQQELGALSEKNQRLQEQIMPRKLSGDYRRQFTKMLLSDAGHNVVIVSAMLDHEAGDFADSFVEPFRDGKWTVPPRVTNWICPKDGVTIGRVDENPLPGENALDAALTAAAIKHSIKPITGDDTHAISPWFAPGTLYLLIGAKPRAETQ